MNHFQKAWQWWDRFWFAPQDLLGLASMRVVLFSVMTYMYSLRLFNLDYYSDSSWIPRSQALMIFPEAIRPLFPWFFWPDSMALAMHVLLVVFLLLLTLGIGGRLLMILTWAISMGFLQRNFAVNFGADIVCSLFMFYMSFTQSCERLSLWNWLRKKKTFRQSDILTSVMIRMMQVQICVIYAYTGFEKLKGNTWWDGTALWNVLANPQMVAFDMGFLRNFPSFIAIMSFLTILFEIYFVPAVLSKKTRGFVLLVGFFFHMGIALLMGLMPFSAAMLSTYFLFMNPLEMRQGLVLFWEKLKTPFRSSSVLS